MLISAKAAGKMMSGPACACFIPEIWAEHTLSIAEEKASGLRNRWSFLSMFGSGPP
jgi:hypothetical protein